MPLRFHRYLFGGGEMGIWQIEEAETYFLDRMVLTEIEQAQFEPMKGHRRLEWLAGRWLLHMMSGREIRGACLKDEHGKPYLEHSLFQISISHSRTLAAVMAGPESVGIDVQKVVPKIERIAHKFMRPEETDSLVPATRLPHLHVYWGAKEALYKAYGRRQLDFKKHIFIHPFPFNSEGGVFKGSILMDAFEAHYELEYELIDQDFVLVWGWEKNGAIDPEENPQLDLVP